VLMEVKRIKKSKAMHVSAITCLRAFCVPYLRYCIFQPFDEIANMLRELHRLPEGER
jgi:hypothetical protein